MNSKLCYVTYLRSTVHLVRTFKQRTTVPSQQARTVLTYRPVLPFMVARIRLMWSDVFGCSIRWTKSIRFGAWVVCKVIQLRCCSLNPSSNLSVVLTQASCKNPKPGLDLSCLSTEPPQVVCLASSLELEECIAWESNHRRWFAWLQIQSII